MDISCTEKELFVFNKIAHTAQELDVPCYIIGGFVRDKLIGRSTKDADIVCVGDGIDLAHAVAKKFNPVPKVAYFKTFGTAQLKLDVWEIEFVGARKESYGYHSRNPDVVPGTLADDQLRRDFTINALAISLNKNDFGTLLDPFHGVQDLHNRIIRTPLDPAATFSDDPLRMLRAIRFAAQLDFTIEPQTFQAIKDNIQRIRIISQERITDELNLTGTYNRRTQQDPVDQEAIDWFRPVVQKRPAAHHLSENG
jgi:tRNA nucleotidyltransferase/poly(A) polymerase